MSGIAEDSARGCRAICLCLAFLLAACSDKAESEDAEDVVDDTVRSDGDAEMEPAEDVVAEPDLVPDATGDVVTDAADPAPDADGPTGVCTMQRFDNPGTYPEGFELGELTVTASDVIEVTGTGIGVVDSMVDDNEWVMFAFAAPKTGIIFETRGGRIPASSDFTSVEAFDGDGESLGTQQFDYGRVHYVSELFGNVPIMQFKLLPEEGAGVPISAVAFECCRVTEDFTTLGNMSTALLELDDVEIEGSADLDLNVGAGLGVVGGDDEMIDGDEWVTFSFRAPVMRASFYVTATSEEYFDATVETFDADGTSLGTSTVELQPDQDVLIRASEYDKISGFKVQSPGDGHTIGSLEFWVDCS